MYFVKASKLHQQFFWDHKKIELYCFHMNWNLKSIENNFGFAFNWNREMIKAEDAYGTTAASAISGLVRRMSSNSAGGTWKIERKM